MSSGKKRPVDSGRRDSAGRRIMLSDDLGKIRADAPAPPAMSDGRYEWQDDTQTLNDGSQRTIWRYRGDMFR